MIGRRGGPRERGARAARIARARSGGTAGPARRARGRVWLLMLLLLAAPAAARDFAGTVASVSAESLRVESRMGDTRAFRRADDTVVSGARSRWSEIARGDRVVVSWSLADAEPVAHHVRVGPAGSR